MKSREELEKQLADANEHLRKAWVRQKDLEIYNEKLRANQVGS